MTWIIELFLLLALSSFSIGLTKPPLVSLRKGQVEGIEEKSVNGKTFSSFLGIPFAKPPVADRRFEDPVEVEPWSGTLLATEQPPICVQYDMIQNFINPDPQLLGDEDCLFLNVHTPKVCSTANMAVMVFIHGGGYTHGSASLYNPHVLLDEDVVLVVIQYRLGVFGFLSTGDEVIPGNLGLKDQTFALKWVRENIGQFGGDRNRVTIFGESAGAGSVHFHMLSPLSKGLFHRAIMQSGSAICPWSTVTNQRELAEQLAQITECPIERADYKECLKKADADTLWKGLNKSYKFGTQPLYASPIVDGEFLEEDPVTLMRKGKYNKVNVMAGITRDEGGIFTALTLLGINTMKGFETKFWESAAFSTFMDTEENSEDLAKKVFDYYLKDKQPGLSSTDEMTKMFTERMFSICHDVTSMFHAMDKDVNLYRYEFVHRGENSVMDLFRMDREKKWVSHVDDLIYLFVGGPLLGPLAISSDEDLKMRSIFVKTWTQFARTGNPSSADDHELNWPATAGSDLSYLALKISPTMENDSRQKIRDFWFSLDTRQNQMLFPNGGTNVFDATMEKDEL